MVPPLVSIREVAAENTVLHEPAYKWIEERENQNDRPTTFCNSRRRRKFRDVVKLIQMHFDWIRLENSIKLHFPRSESDQYWLIFLRLQDFISVVLFKPGFTSILICTIFVLFCIAQMKLVWESISDNVMPQKFLHRHRASLKPDGKYHPDSRLLMS